MAALGLILDFIGGILLFISAEKLNSEILRFMRNPADKSDAVVGISVNELESISALNSVSLSSNKYSRVGLLLLIVGFLLQAIASF
jgi:hypothetical protein